MNLKHFSHEAAKLPKAPPKKANDFFLFEIPTGRTLGSFAALRNCCSSLPTLGSPITCQICFALARRECVKCLNPDFALKTHPLFGSEPRLSLHEAKDLIG